MYTHDPVHTCIHVYLHIKKHNFIRGHQVQRHELINGLISKIL